MFGKSSKAGKRTGKKPYATLHDIQEQSPEQNLSKLENDVVNVITNAEGQNSFFCTDEQFVVKFDDAEILKYIRASLPNFGVNPGCTAFKQAMFEFLENDAYVKQVMDQFELEINELFKFLFRIDPSVFKGMFMKRIKEIAARKQYSVRGS